MGDDQGLRSTPVARSIDPQIALELFARQIWITTEIDLGRRDGVEAAQAWDEDWLVTATYEKFEAMAYDAVTAETKRRVEEDREAGYGD